MADTPATDAETAPARRTRRKADGADAPAPAAVAPKARRKAATTGAAKLKLATKPKTVAARAKATRDKAVDTAAEVAGKARARGRAAVKAATPSRQTGAVMAAGAAGLVAGLAANLVRKAVVQAPTALAGSWDEALKAEHQAVLAIFDRIEQTTEANAGRRGTLLAQLKHALGKHALQEENAVYAALRDHAQKEGADKLNHEHGYVKQYLYDLGNMDRASPAWIAKVREFRGMIQNHMVEEENDIFPRMRGVLSDEQNKQLTIAMNREGLKIA